MTTETPADHIALAVRRAGWWTGEPTSDEIAEELLGALAAAGYAVVPEDCIADNEDLWDAGECVLYWRGSDNCDDTPEYQKRLYELSRRLRQVSNNMAFAGLVAKDEKR